MNDRLQQSALAVIAAIVLCVSLLAYRIAMEAVNLMIGVLN